MHSFHQMNVSQDDQHTDLCPTRAKESRTVGGTGQQSTKWCCNCISFQAVPPPPLPENPGRITFIKPADTDESVFLQLHDEKGTFIWLFTVHSLRDLNVSLLSCVWFFCLLVKTTETRPRPGSIETRPRPGSIETRPGSIETRPRPGSMETNEDRGVSRRDRGLSRRDRDRGLSRRDRNETETGVSIEMRPRPGSIETRPRPSLLRRDRDRGLLRRDRDFEALKPNQESNSRATLHDKQTIDAPQIDPKDPRCHETRIIILHSPLVLLRVAYVVDASVFLDERLKSRVLFVCKCSRCWDQTESVRNQDRACVLQHCRLLIFKMTLLHFNMI